MNIYEKMMTVKVTGNEEIIRNMILDDPFLFIDLQPESIVRKCHVSRAALYRFCDKLEVNGVSDLKMKLSADYESWRKTKNHFDFDYPVPSGVSATAVVQSLKEDYEKTLQASYNLFDVSVLQRCAIEMNKASHIDIYASAGNIYFADNFRFQLAEIGVNANVPHEQYLHSLTAASSDAGHFAIVITFGGRGLLVKDVLRSLKKNHTKILLISSEEAKDINSYADYRLCMPMTENHSRKISSYSTRLSLLYILDALYTCYFEMHYKENLKKKTEFYRIMTENNNQ